MKKRITHLIIKDEVNVQFKDLDPDTRKEIVNKLKFFLPHAKYSPSYKLGRWDGTISFATIGGSTYLNLLDVVFPILESRGYEVEVLEDRRKTWDLNFTKIDENYLSSKVWGKDHPMENQPIILRDYQVNIINNFLENPQSIQEVATGSGKCLDGNTEIFIKTNNKDFYKFFWQKSIKEDEFAVTFNDLKNFLEKNGLEFFCNFSEKKDEYIYYIGNEFLFVETPKGWEKIVFFVIKENQKSLKITFFDTELSKYHTLICSPKHIFYRVFNENNVNISNPKNNIIKIFAENLKKNTEIVGKNNKKLIVTHIEPLESRDLFDISIPYPHMYYTSEGILHHNTIITASLSKKIDEKGYKSVIIVPSKQLVLQTEKDYKLVDLDVGVYFGDRKEVGRNHTIATWQSLNYLFKDKKIDKSWLENIAAVIVDEVHAAKASELKKILIQHFSNVPIRWGLTGTIPKENLYKVSIISSIGPVISRTSAKKLQELGVLSNVNIFCLEQKLGNLNFRSWHEEQDFLLKNPERLLYIANLLNEVSKTGNTLVLFNFIETGELLHKILEEMGSDVSFVNGSTSVKIRQEIFDETNYKNNKIILATSGVASVGINILRVFNLVLLEPGKSFVRIIQSIGRGLRKGKDKKDLVVYDIFSSTRFSKKHAKQRENYYKENYWNIEYFNF